MDLDSFKARMKAAANFNIDMALKSVPYVMDLEPILIVEQTGARRFITSDNPVVRYNSFYLNNCYPGGFGYITRGLQFFFPISPQKCIMLYDSIAYDIPEANNRVLTLKRARDVDQLNELFYLNAYNNVFINQKTKKEYIEGIHSKNKRTPKINVLDREVASFKSVDSKGTLVSLSQNRVSKNINFSWMKMPKIAKGLKLPPHMGGLQRTESPFIMEFLAREKEEMAQYQPPFSERFYRVEK